MDWLSELGYAHWWVLAAFLLILELTTKVFFFLWLSFAAAAVGFLLLVFPSIPGGLAPPGASPADHPGCRIPAAGPVVDAGGADRRRRRLAAG